ncbi:hypothetical protein V5799_016804, partial [Amblyomma americanum]
MTTAIPRSRSSCSAEYYEEATLRHRAYRARSSPLDTSVCMESLPSSSPLHLQFPSSQELLARFTYYDYAVFVCMLAVSGSLGLWSAWQDSRSDTHSGISLLLNGERRLPPVPVGASLMASFISAAYLLGNAAEVYRSGTLYLMTFVSYVLALAVTAHLFMPVFYRLGVMTAYE